MKTINSVNFKYSASLMGLTLCLSSAIPSTLSASQLTFSTSSGHHASCNDLNGFSISPGAIGLPTKGAVVVSASLVAASGSGPTALGEYCSVTGEIRPVSNSAPKIRFQANLPTGWNGKAMMFGGGGFDGELVFVNFLHAAASNQISPQGHGYAVYGGDSGHVQNDTYIFGRDGSFATNDEALANYASDSLKKTHDAVMNVINRFYGHGPSRSYFGGGSMGGREALMVAQKWPQDFDGVIAIYPVVSATGWFLQMGRVSQAMAMPGGYLSDEKRKLVLQLGMNACDGLDGVVDGLISNTQACNAMFKMGANGVLPPALAAARCPGGGDTGPHCLSDAQIYFLDTFNSALNLNSPLSSGAKGYPGFNVWGADLGIISDKPELFLSLVLGLNLVSPAQPVAPDQPDVAVFSDQWWKYFVTRNSNFNSLMQSPSSLGPWQGRVNDLSLMLDASDQLAAFHARGGKMLIMHGSADILVSTRATEQYYDSLVARLGKNRVRDFVRFYETPGYGHSVSLSFLAGWDAMSALENWVENGHKPHHQIVEDKLAIPGRTRPLCEYPAWPAYKGNGDVNQASSFKCVKSGDADDQNDEHENEESEDD